MTDKYDQWTEGHSQIDNEAACTSKTKDIQFVYISKEKCQYRNFTDTLKNLKEEDIGPVNLNWFDDLSAECVTSDKVSVPSSQSHSKSDKSHGNQTQLQESVSCEQMVAPPARDAEFDANKSDILFSQEDVWSTIFPSHCQQATPVTHLQRKPGWRTSTPSTADVTSGNQSDESFHFNLLSTPDLLCCESPLSGCDRKSQNDFGKLKTSTPGQRLCEKLGLDPDESNISWTTSMATPPTYPCTEGFNKEVNGSEEKDTDSFIPMGAARTLFSPPGDAARINSDDFQRISFSDSQKEDNTNKKCHADITSKKIQSVGGLAYDSAENADRELQNNPDFSIACPQDNHKNVHILPPEPKETYGIIKEKFISKEICKISSTDKLPYDRLTHVTRYDQSLEERTGKKNRLKATSPGGLNEHYRNALLHRQVLKDEGFKNTNQTGQIIDKIVNIDDINENNVDRDVLTSSNVYQTDRKSELDNKSSPLTEMSSVYDNSSFADSEVPSSDKLFAVNEALSIFDTPPSSHSIRTKSAPRNRKTRVASKGNSDVTSKLKRKAKITSSQKQNFNSGINSSSANRSRRTDDQYECTHSTDIQKGCLKNVSTNQEQFSSFNKKENDEPGIINPDDTERRLIYDKTLIGDHDESLIRECLLSCQTLTDPEVCFKSPNRSATVTANTNKTASHVLSTSASVEPVNVSATHVQSDLTIVQPADNVSNEELFSQISPSSLTAICQAADSVNIKHLGPRQSKSSKCGDLKSQQPGLSEHNSKLENDCRSSLALKENNDFAETKSGDVTNSLTEKNKVEKILPVQTDMKSDESFHGDDGFSQISPDVLKAMYVASDSVNTDECEQMSTLRSNGNGSIHTDHDRHITPVKWKKSVIKFKSSAKKDINLGDSDEQENNKSFPENLTSSELSHGTRTDTNVAGQEQNVRLHSPLSSHKENIPQVKAKSVLARRTKRFFYPTSSQISKSSPTKIFQLKSNSDNVHKENSVSHFDNNVESVNDSLTSTPPGAGGDNCAQGVMKDASKKKPAQPHWKRYSAEFTSLTSYNTENESKAEVTVNRIHHGNSVTKSCAPFFAPQRRLQYGTADTEKSSATNVSNQKRPVIFKKQIPPTSLVNQAGKCQQQVVEQHNLSKHSTLKKHPPDVTSEVMQPFIKKQSASVTSPILTRADTEIIETENVRNKDNIEDTRAAPEHFGFQTASGKRVNVSDDSLQRGQRLIAEAESEHRAEPADCAEDVKYIQKNNANSDKVSQSPSVTTASHSLKASSFKDACFNSIKDSSFESKDTVNQITLEKESYSHPKFQGFQCASGKAVSLTVESLAKAKSLLEECENSTDLKGEKKENDLLNLGIGNNEKKKMHIIDDQNEKLNAKDPASSGFGGFKCASGRAVSLSETSLQKAKRLMDEVFNEAEKNMDEDEEILTNVSDNLFEKEDEHDVVKQNLLELKLNQRQKKDNSKLPKGFRPFKRPRIVNLENKNDKMKSLASGGECNPEPINKIQQNSSKDILDHEHSMAWDTQNNRQNNCKAEDIINEHQNKVEGILYDHHNKTADAVPQVDINDDTEDAMDGFSNTQWNEITTSTAAFLQEEEHMGMSQFTSREHHINNEIDHINNHSNCDTNDDIRDKNDQTDDHGNSDQNDYIDNHKSNQKDHIRDEIDHISDHHGIDSEDPISDHDDISDLTLVNCVSSYALHEENQSQMKFSKDHCQNRKLADSEENSHVCAEVFSEETVKICSKSPEMRVRQASLQADVLSVPNDSNKANCVPDVVVSLESKIDTKTAQENKGTGIMKLDLLNNAEKSPSHQDQDYRKREAIKNQDLHKKLNLDLEKSSQIDQGDGDTNTKLVSTEITFPPDLQDEDSNSGAWNRCSVFQTAGGQSLSFSQKSLKKARRLLSEEREREANDDLSQVMSDVESSVLMDLSGVEELHDGWHGDLDSFADDDINCKELCDDKMSQHKAQLKQEPRSNVQDLKSEQGDLQKIKPTEVDSEDFTNVKVDTIKSDCESYHEDHLVNVPDRTVLMQDASSLQHPHPHHDQIQPADQNPIPKQISESRITVQQFASELEGMVNIPQKPADYGTFQNRITLENTDKSRNGVTTVNKSAQEGGDFCGDSVCISDATYKTDQIKTTSASEISMTKMSVDIASLNMVNRMKHLQEFSPFTTASGNKVTISKKALLQAAKMMEEQVEEPSNNPQNVLEFSPFTTASGNQISNSKEALEKADKNMNEESTVNFKEFSLFTTASGNKVNISRNALQKATEMMTEDSTNKADNCQEFAPFTTASGNKVSISKKALQRAKTIMNEDSVEDFQKVSPFTASCGNKINNSRKALDQATEMMKKNSREDFQEVSPFTTSSGYKANVSRKALQQATDKIKEDSIDRSNNIHEFAPLKTASGIEVGTSEKTLQQARKMMHEHPAEDFQLFASFTTASGNKVNVSKKALQQATNMMKEELLTKSENFQEFAPFSTASGNKVKVSKKALQQATNMMKEDLLTVSENFQEFVPFSTASGNKVKVSKKALQQATNMMKEDLLTVSENFQEFAPFNTASGNKVKVSKKALEQVAEILTENSPSKRDIVHEFEPFTTASGNKVDVSKKALEEAMKMTNKDTPEKKDNVLKFAPFQTASGNKVSVSEKALEEAKKMMNEDSTHNKETIPEFAPFLTVSGNKVSVSKKALEQAKKMMNEDSTHNKDTLPEFAPFLTVSGNKVSVSEKALEQAKKMMNEDSTHNKDTLPEFAPFQTASGNKVSVSEKALEQAKKMINEDLSHNKDNIQEFAPFTTASGSKVNISRKALEQAAKLMSDKDSLSKKDSHYESALFTTASKNIMNISKQVTKIRNENDNSYEISPFSTASGSRVNVSKKSLHQANQLFQSVQHEDQKQILPKDNEFGKLPGQFAEDSLGGVVADSDAQKHCTRKLEADLNISFETSESVRALLEDGAFNEFSPSHDGSFSEDTSIPPDKCLAGNSVSECRIIHKPWMRAVNSTPEGLLNDREQSQFAKVLKPAVTVPMGDSSKYRLEESRNRSRAVKIRHHDRNMFTPKGHFAVTRQRQENMHINGEVCKNKSTSGFTTPIKIPFQANNAQRCGENGKPQSAQKSSFQTPYKTKQDQPGTPRDTQQSEVSQARKRKSSGDIHLPDSKTSRGSAVAPSSAFTSNLPANVTASHSRESSGKIIGKSTDLILSEDVLKQRQEAREAQIQRIKLKKSGGVQPNPGTLYRLKKSRTRISLREHVNRSQPWSCSDRVLLSHGISAAALNVKASNAKEYRFNAADFYSNHVVQHSSTVRVGDGAVLVFSGDSTVGKEEICSALLDLPNVDPKLASLEWVYNHYRWIVWKLAALEVAFPRTFGGRMLTPENVMLQLKYRYDREVDMAQRPALRKIIERDDTPSKTLILCVSKITVENVLSDQKLTPNKHQQGARKLGQQCMLEVTDGWYSIKALADQGTHELIQRGRITVGTKIVLFGCELTGSTEACSPLEAPADLMLKICINSMRPARWDAHLGFYRNPKPPPLPLNSLYCDGGMVACVDVIVTRVYPIQHMEKLPDGSTIFRNEKSESLAAQKFEEERQRNMEKIYSQIQAEFEKKNDKISGNSKRRRSCSKLTVKQIEALTTGWLIHDALQSSADPGSIEALLSSHQVDLLLEHQREMQQKQQAEIQAEIQSRMDDLNQVTSRSVCPLLKVRVSGCLTKDVDAKSGAILSIWRPDSSLIETLKEGRRFHVFSLQVGPARGRYCTDTLHFTAVKTTLYIEKEIDENFKDLIYEPREVLPFCELSTCTTQPAYGEIDVVGIVIHVTMMTGDHQTVFLADTDEYVLPIRFWGGLQAFNVEDVMKAKTVVSVSNLQWRPGASRSLNGRVVATDLSVFSSKPRASHLIRAMEKLQKQIKDMNGFVKKMQNHMQGIEEFGGKDLHASKLGSVDVNQPSAHHTTDLTMSIGKSPSQLNRTPCSVSMDTGLNKAEPTTPSGVILSSEDKRTAYIRSKERRLEQYGTPPPLTPLISPLQASVRRGFKPPRLSSGHMGKVLQYSHTRCKSGSPKAAQSSNPVSTSGNENKTDLLDENNEKMIQEKRDLICNESPLSKNENQPSKQTLKLNELKESEEETGVLTAECSGNEMKSFSMTAESGYCDSNHMNKTDDLVVISYPDISVKSGATKTTEKSITKQNEMSGADKRTELSPIVQNILPPSDKPTEASATHTKEGQAPNKPTETSDTQLNEMSSAKPAESISSNNSENSQLELTAVPPRGKRKRKRQSAEVIDYDLLFQELSQSQEGSEDSLVTDCSQASVGTRRRSLRSRKTKL